jgi:hypothetical protein
MAGRLSMATERLASAMKPLPTSSFGYPVREPVPSEQAFFALNPNVGGYAAEDGAIVLNEGARSGDRYLSNRELGGVARNEASRLYMRDRSIVPDFSLTKDQELEFQGTAYGSNPEALKQSIAARIITGDQSAGETTKEQQSFAQSLLKQMGANGEPVATNPEPKRGIMARVANKLEQVLGVPRPWELGLAPSVGYQLATGEGSLGERVRKGGAQWMGRYVTNIKEPATYQLPTSIPIAATAMAIAKDQPQWLKGEPEDWKTARETLYREMFDLPPRIPTQYLEKTGEKQYKLKDYPEPAPNYFHPIMGGVYMEPTPSGYKYNDIWDIVSGEEFEAFEPTYPIRKAIAPFLRPASISGTVTVSGPTAP